MVYLLGVHRFDKTQAIRDGCRVGQEVGNPSATFTALRKFSDWCEHRPFLLALGHCAQTFAFLDLVGDLSAVPLQHLGLVIEQIGMGRRSVLQQIDHPPCFGREMRQIAQSWLSAGGQRVFFKQ